ncbi:hypothetical protein ACFQMA_19545 [Halosimplex aquaticum]|uniref:Small CPxCG-related zinc finger protein n=1 Tax=Halosimplex aquaticum TaxID=3026162 RepID=A0ABD5Y3L1_9EURY|nr:hypothetical protein [Halosimplex aquaticum]
MRETDLPCSDCGASLVERVVFTADLPIETDGQSSARIARCDTCGARYYPHRTVSQLAGRSNASRRRRSD